MAILYCRRCYAYGFRGLTGAHLLTTMSGAQSLSPSNVQVLSAQYILRKKKVREFPVPSRDVTTKLSLGGNYDVITELFLPRRSLVSDIPAGDGKLVNLFLRCISRFIALLIPFSETLPRCNTEHILFLKLATVFCFVLTRLLWSPSGLGNKNFNKIFVC
jgi:hypothetical protein